MVKVCDVFKRGLSPSIYDSIKPQRHRSALEELRGFDGSGVVAVRQFCQIPTAQYRISQVLLEDSSDGSQTMFQSPTPFAITPSRLSFRCLLSTCRSDILGPNPKPSPLCTLLAVSWSLSFRNICVNQPRSDTSVPQWKSGYKGSVPRIGHQLIAFSTTLWGPDLYSVSHHHFFL
jgi:hypothetical protein